MGEARNSPKIKRYLELSQPPLRKPSSHARLEMTNLGSSRNGNQRDPDTFHPFRGSHLHFDNLLAPLDLSPPNDIASPVSLNRLGRLLVAKLQGAIRTMKMNTAH